MSELDDELLQAYVDALYRVEDKFDFRIGEYSEGLARLHADRGASHSHFITAFNPESRRLPAADNARRHARLGEALEALGVTRLPAAGLDPKGEWPPEPGYLVLDLATDDVLSLGRAFEQNAVVTIGADAVPRLVLIAKPEP